MPTYDYECRGCGKTFEIFHGMGEAPRKRCPKCGKNRLERLIGAGSGFLFKGSGFYITDYRSADYKAKAKADSEGSASKGSSPAGAASSSSPTSSSGSSSGGSSSASSPPGSTGGSGSKGSSESKKPGKA